MTVLGDEVRQEIFLILIQTGGRGGIRWEIFKKWDIYLALQFHTI